MSKYSLLQYPKNPKLDRMGAPGDALRFFIHSVANPQKIEGRRKKFCEKKQVLKKSQFRKKIESGDLSGFFNIHSVAENWGEEPFVELFLKSSTMPKKLKGGPFSLARYFVGSVPWANRYNLGSFKFCRTFLVTSGVSKKNTDEKP